VAYRPLLVELRSWAADLDPPPKKKNIGCGAPYAITSEWLKIDLTNDNRLKIGVFQEGGSVSAKFSRKRGRPPPIIYTRIDRPMNALQLCRWRFHTKKLRSRPFSNKVRF